MFAVHGQNRLADALRRVHHQVAARHQRFLVRQQHLPIRPQRVHHALQPGNADHADEHHVRRHFRRRNAQCLFAHDPAAEAHILRDFAHRDGFGQTRDFRPELPHLLEQLLPAAPCRQRDDAELLRMQAHKFQRLCTNRPRRPQNGDGLHGDSPSYISNGLGALPQTLQGAKEMGRSSPPLTLSRDSVARTFILFPRVYWQIRCPPSGDSTASASP